MWEKRLHYSLTQQNYYKYVLDKWMHEWLKQSRFEIG